MKNTRHANTKAPDTVTSISSLYRNILLIFMMTGPFISYASTITVDSTNATSGATSLRSAVHMASSGDTIRFHSSIDGDTIFLVTEITLDKNLVIIGNDTMSTIIDGMATSRIFYIPVGDTVSISGFKMQGGNGAGATSSGSGGAILNQGSLTLTNSAVNGNSATNGAGIYNDTGTMTLTNSTVSGNSATNFGGGIYNDTGTMTLTNSTVSGNSATNFGGGIFNNGTLTLTNNTVSGNSADFGGGVINFATMTLTNNTVSGNSATNDGGGIYTINSTMTLTNNTVSGNSATNGAGIYTFNGILTLTNNTVSGNSATNDGGGIYNNGSTATMTLTNSIVAKNSDNGSGPDIYKNQGTITDGGHNLIGDTTSVGADFMMSTLLGNTTNPLDPLFVTDVGTVSLPNSTGDLRLQCGSPAIDAGDNTANTTTEDILGNPRIESAGGTIDIGAYERPADTGNKIVTTIEDDGPGSLRDLIRTACAGDTIRFDSGIDGDTIKLITEITLDKNLVIIGNDTMSTIIDGMATSRICYIPTGDTVSISGIKMQGGNGAGFQPFSGTTTYGGAILNQGAVTLTNSTVSGNSASIDGGGIYNTGSATLTLTNSTVSGNSATLGGGIFNRRSATLTNSTVSDNSATYGGGIYNSFGTMTLTNTTVSGNSATYGGGITNDGLAATMTLTNSTVSGNSTSFDGGGITNNGTMTLTNTTVSGNSATDDGGGIYNFATMTLTNSTVSGNSATYGGGIYNRATLTLTNSTVSGNSATDDGGGITNDLGILTLTNSTLSGNSASNSGGGIANFGTMTLTNSTVSGNSATNGSGGGMYNNGSAATMTLTNSAVSGNSASSSGGGIYTFNGTLTLTNSTVSGNSASIDGGGIYNTFNGTLTLTNSTVSGNSATITGGGIYHEFGTLTLTNSIVAKNSDNGSGPDIYKDQGTITDGGHNLIGDTTSVGADFMMSTLLGNTTNPLDPLFVTDVGTVSIPNSTGDLRLQCGSPAIDAGDNTANTTTEDFLGNPRIESAGGTIDIGAYERPADTGNKIVTTIEDDGPGSLRDLIRTACAGDTIRFDSGIDGDTIKLITEIIIDTNLVIIGNHTMSTIIDGMATSRIFYIPAGDTVSISDIKMQGGNGAGTTSSGSGGAILNQGSLTLTNSAVSGNSATNSGGGIYNDVVSTLILTNSTVSGNSATSGFGGGIYNRGSATLTNSTVSGNSANSGFGGGIFNIFGSTLTLTNSTVSGNSATNSGGGIYNDVVSTLILTNSTVSGNSATSGFGGGIFNIGTMTLTNSIVAKNSASVGTDIQNNSTLNDGGNNLIGDTTSVGSDFMMSTLLGNSAIPIDPLFVMDVDMMSLPNSTGDLRLQCGSPAIDAGTADTTGLNVGNMDLGGLARINGARIDIGAHEAIVQLSIDAELLNHDNLPTEIRAISSITSNGIIDDDESFRFYAGDSIILLPFFEVEFGGSFEAQIESCETMSTLIDNWSDVEQKGTSEERRVQIIEALRALKD